MNAIKKYWKWVLVLVLLLVNIFVWSTAAGTSRHDYLTLAVLDVGQGDSLLLTDEVGHQILIDGGPDNSVLSRLPLFLPNSDRSLDLLILTHPHADHVSGLVEVLKRYQVGAVLETGAMYESATYDEWHRLLAEKKIPIITARRGEVVRLADGATLDILTPFGDWHGRTSPNIHDAMVVTRLVVGDRAALLTGDMEAPLEAQLLAASSPPAGGLKSDILKVGHHGSKTSSSPAFLQAVAPTWAVISVGARNRYGHPYPQTITNLDKAGIKILRTDRDGTIIFTIHPTVDKIEVSMIR